jgi:DMSO/TMAO reductase YedYZ molybdopterin-dependent catalytic subunit
VTLPPGQKAADGFPRFGTHFHHPPPAVPPDPVIEIGGVVDEPFTFPVPGLATMPRRQLTSDLHCVAGWSATGLDWEGVEFKAFFEAIVEPALRSGGTVTHVVFEGLDGYRSIVLAEDALSDGVLIADRLAGQPLTADHGAPVRLVSPMQYGFISTKHLSRIEFHSHAPAETYHPKRLIQVGVRIVKPHRRARVWAEERHRYLPGRVVRPIYTRLIPGIRWLSAKGRRP